MEANFEDRLAALSKQLAELRKRVHEMERPQATELLNYRFQEFRELVEYLSVMTQTDVLNNCLASLRLNKKAVEEAMVKAKEEKKEEKKVAVVEEDDQSL